MCMLSGVGTLHVCILNVRDLQLIVVLIRDQQSSCCRGDKLKSNKDARMLSMLLLPSGLH